MEPRSRARRSRRVAALAAVVVGVLVAGCTGAPGGTAQDGEREFSFGTQVPVNSLDPAELHDGQQGYVWSAVYDSLLYTDNEGELQPSAAESWSWSDDARTLTLTLREGMTFSNGAPVTARAVSSTLERTAALPGPQQGNLAAVALVEATDERTVVLSLSRPDPNLLYALSNAAGVIGDPGSFDDPGLELNPVGSGPYTLDTVATVAGSSYVLHKRADHWNAAAYPFDTVTVRVLPDRTALFNALVSGEVDAGTVESTRVEAAERAGVSVQRVDGITVGELVIADRAGTLAPQLADVRVRQAINLAFDRQKIVDQVMGGYGAATTQVFNLVSSAYVPELDERYPYDPERARRLLAEAGYGNGFSLTMPSNLPSQIYEPTITQALGDIGITVDWQPVPPQSSGASTEFPIYVNMAAAAPPTRTVSTKLLPTSSQNPFGSQDPALDALIGAVATQVDLDQAAQGYRDINTWVVDNAWFAPLFSISANWGTREGVEFVGTAANPSSTIRTFALTPGQG